MLKTGTTNGSALVDLGGPNVTRSRDRSDSGFADALDGQMKRINGSESASSPQKAENAKASERHSRDDSGESGESGARRTAEERGPKARSESAEPRKADSSDHSEETKKADTSAVDESEPTETRVELVELIGESEVDEGEPAPSRDEQSGNGLPSDSGKELPPVLVTGAEQAAVEAERQSKSAESGRQTGISVQASTRTEQMQLWETEGRQRIRFSDVLAERAAESKDKAAEGLRPSLENGKGSDKFFELLTAGRNALTGRDAAAVDLAGAARGGREAATTGLGREPSFTIPMPGAGGATSQPVQSAGASMPTTNINVPVQQQGWDQALGEKVVWMTRQNLNQAQVQLNPRHLGPIELKVAVSQDQVNVQFNVQNPVTREAVEAAMPRLREMLSESGLNLAQSDVSDHPKGGQGTSDAEGEGTDSRGTGPFAERADGEEVDEPLMRETALGDLGMVDYFA